MPRRLHARFPDAGHEVIDAMVTELHREFDGKPICDIRAGARRAPGRRPPRLASSSHHRTVSPSAPRVVVDGHVVESEAKTTSGVRNLALDPDTAAALEDSLIVWEEEGYLLGQQRRLLFIWPDGRSLHPDTITAQFHNHCEAAGMPRIRLHDVRHSYASAALKAGILAKVISERLGHSTAASRCRSTPT